jgi:lipopolysaccharide biosynthesis protein
VTEDQDIMPPVARLIAFYLPQFHPIPENDEWWGKGFTEWTNVTKAQPRFRGHYQPRLPADLGYYDLRVPEVREAQANMARNAGIEAFCYYHYWFAGKRLLERPWQEVVASGKPDFPFCLCWANQTWTGIWHGAPNRVLIEQTYPGAEDNRKHFEALRPAFLDARYERIDGRPIFVIYRPMDIPNVRDFISQWQQLARESGLPGIHFVAHLTNFETTWDFRSQGFDSCVIVNTLKFVTLSMRQLLLARHGFGPKKEAPPGTFRGVLRHGLWRRYRALLGRFNNVAHYRHAQPFLLDGASTAPDVHPCITPNWDNTPRSGNRGVVLHEATPELFRLHLRQALCLVKDRVPEQRVLFVKSWNEWAEGNYLEPDQKFGHAYLDVVREEVLRG